MNTLEPSLYQPIKPNHEEYLQVSTLHKIFIREYGNPKGVPVVVLHGGPGAGCTDIDAQFFDPYFYRIILVDQRASGQSQPFLSTVENTTQDLVNDLEKIRNHYGIDKWFVFGGSWGSTLGLVYGETYPQSCLGFILRGIFLGTIEEGEHIVCGMKDLFPIEWQKICDLLSEKERENFTVNYCKKILSTDEKISHPAIIAAVWYNSKASFLHITNADLENKMLDLAVVEGVAKNFAHYHLNDYFLKPNQILNEIERINHLPCIIVNGRYDSITRPHTAYVLHKNWPSSELVIVEKSGHARTDFEMAKSLVFATNRMKEYMFTKIVKNDK